MAQVGVPETADALVIGGGPAGSAAAIALARAGASVTLVERDRIAGAKVCGEFLSVEACDEARALGVDPLELGAAEIDRVRVMWRGTTVESLLPFRAASLSRAAFDQAMLAAAERSGARVLRGARASALDAATVAVRDEAATRILRAPAIVMATGKTELPGFRRSGGHFPDAVGFKMHVELDPRQREELDTAVELTLFAGGYAGMQRIENGLVALAAVVRRDAYSRLGSWSALLAAIVGSNPRTARRLEGANERWPKPLAVSGVPYGFTYRESPGETPRLDLYRTGDQLAVIPSFTGDGIAIALVSGACAARAIVRGEPATAFHAAMRERLRTPMFVAGTLSRAIGSAPGRAAVVWPARVAPQIFSFVAARTRIPRDRA